MQLRRLPSLRTPRGSAPTRDARPTDAQPTDAQPTGGHPTDAHPTDGHATTAHTDGHATDGHATTAHTDGHATDEHGRRYDPRVFAVQRVGALAVAAVILVFGLLGFAGGLDFFSTDGEPILGLSSNGLLSTVSVLTAGVLVLAALRSPRTASTLMMVVGILFLLSGLLSLAVLRTDANLLAFEIENVIFAEVTGLVLLLLGAYGRVSGNLPSDSPYARPRQDDDDTDDGTDGVPSTPEEFAAERAMREAEIAVVNHTATPDQRRRVEAMARVHSRGDRRRVWMEMD